MNYYQKPISEIFIQLGTSPNGLSDDGGFLRLNKYGPNVLKRVKKTSLIFKFLHQFKDLLAIILVFGAILSFVIGSSRDALIILGIVFVNATISFIQEYKAERILAAFQKHLPSFATVMRNGKLKKILASQIVPGDIVFLEAGDAVPADARLIESFNLKTNDFALTGESGSQIKKAYSIEKEVMVTNIDNMVFMGTSVAEGKAKVVVVKTGMETEFGKIAKISQSVKEEATPLQKELNYTAKITAQIALIVAAFVILVFTLLGRETQESLLLGIAIAVSVVPEGLPAATSVALSLGAQRMLKKKALIKKLLHVESLGSVTTICTDKTGTLTTGEMNVVKTDIIFKDLFLKTLVLCNNASISSHPIGDPLEIALLNYAAKEKINTPKIQKENPRVFEIPFSSKRKMMTVVCQKSGIQYAYSKGAPLEILERCKINSDDKEEIIKEQDKMAISGLRVVALAYKKLPHSTKASWNKELEKELIFLGLVGLEDPPREGVKEAINLCQKAQIKVIMITGDYGLTALSIAKEIGLSDSETKVITGSDLHQMDNDRLKSILEGDVIFARIDPGQKLRIIQNLQEMGEVVAVTGDGVNDAPALVKADIGVAMGKIGTDVAKEAADMILLDDHFATIVNAIKEGRRIFDNAKKFVFYVFASNSGEFFVTLFGLLLGLPLPLIAVQILAIDLGTDVMPSLALGLEKEEPDVMEKPPRSRTGRIMSTKMLSNLLFIGINMATLALIVFIFSLYEGGWRYKNYLSPDSTLYFSATAATYATLVLCQVATAFHCRSQKLSVFKLGFWTNPSLIFAELVSFILLWAVAEFHPLQNIFRTSSPSPLSWLLIIISFFIYFGLTEWWKRRKSLPELTLKSH